MLPQFKKISKRGYKYNEWLQRSISKKYGKCAKKRTIYTNFSFLSLQSSFRSITVRSKNRKMVAGGVKEQAEQCLKNIKAIVESVDHAMDDVVKVTVFLKNSADSDAVDEVYTTFFPSDIPARTTLAVSALPMGAFVRIDAVVSNAEGTPPVA